jgi:MFS transporter, DHA1 family, multidrug resistance protein
MRGSGASRGDDLRRLTVLGGLVALAPLSTDAYVPGLPRIASDLHASASSTQLTVTAVLIGLALGQLLVGPLSDCLGRRSPLLAGLAVYTVTSLTAAIAPDVGALIGVRAVQGAAGATVLVVAYAMVRDLSGGPALARRLSSLLLVSGVAPVLAPLIGAGVMRVAGWRVIFVLLGAVAALLLVAAARTLPESLAAQRRQTTSVRGMLTKYRVLANDRVLVGYTAVSSLVFAAMFAYISASPFVLEHTFGLSPQAYSGVFAINAIGLVAAAQAGGRLAGRLSPQRLVAVGVLMTLSGAAGLVASAAITSALVPLLAALFVVVTSVGLVIPNAMAVPLSRRQEDSGSAAALLGCGQFLLGGLIAPIMTLFGSVTAMSMAVTIAVLAALAAGALATRPGRRLEAGGPAGTGPTACERWQNTPTPGSTSSTGCA